MCIIKCPNEFISGVGLKLYFSGGIASAAATMFLENRASCPFTAVLTGFTIGAVSAVFCAFDGATACFAHALPAASTVASTAHILSSLQVFITVSLLSEFAVTHTPAPHLQQAGFAFQRSIFTRYSRAARSSGNAPAVNRK